MTLCIPELRVSAISGTRVRFIGEIDGSLGRGYFALRNIRDDNVSKIVRGQSI